VRTESLEKTYPDGNVRALRGVTLAIAEHEFVAITGPSGCGKSTLLHLIGGLDQPSSGDVFFQSSPLRQIDVDAFRAQRLGFVFQSFHLIPTLSAVENIQVPMFEANLTRGERVKRAQRLLQDVGLGHRANHLPSRMSVGERQRTAIARALANNPTLLLADEPTGNLDSATQGEVLELLARVRKERRLTMVVVTHSPEVAHAADREIRLRDGQVV
jgi:putative ABC transport system ATP-binding protein